MYCVACTRDWTLGGGIRQATKASRKTLWWWRGDSITGGHGVDDVASSAYDVNAFADDVEEEEVDEVMDSSGLRLMVVVVDGGEEWLAKDEKGVALGRC